MDSLFKFTRNYRLLIDNQQFETSTVEPPFTIDFEVLRNHQSSANTSKVRIYNLAEKTRNILLKNPNASGFRNITLEAGYGNQTTTVLHGGIKQCWSYREGVNFITEVESFDGGFAFTNALADKIPPFPAGTTKRKVIETLIDSLKDFGISKGFIGDFPDTLIKSKSYTGSTVDNLRNLTDKNFFIDNGIAHAIPIKEYQPGTLTLISSEMGLLGTPVREEGFLRVETLFEPRFVMRQQVELISSTAPKNYSGIYTIVELHHRGTISESVCGNATTQIGLLGAEPSTIRALIINQ